jgi:hypothetical protein
VRLEWDILRYRRLKLSLISKFAHPEPAKDTPLLKEWCEKLSFHLLGTHAPQEPDAIEQADNSAIGRRTDDLIVQQMPHHLTSIRRIDRLIAVAINRRNDSLRKIEQHRALFGAA